MDDIIVTGDDEKEIVQLKKILNNEFEIKDLKKLRYFFGMEIARSRRTRYIDFLEEVYH